MVRLSACLAVLLCCGCTESSYVVGSLCGADRSCSQAGGGGATANGGAGGGGTGGGAFDLDFTGSGVERLPELLLGQPPTHLLVASDATTAGWPARIGEGFAATSEVTLREPWPFADAGSALSHASGVAYRAQSSWESAEGALVLELVFRAAPGATLLSQLGAAGGLEVAIDSSSRLSWRLVDGGSEVSATSAPLTVDAWHHCVLLYDPASGAQVVCNGQAGDLAVAATVLTTAPPSAPALIGSDSPATIHWASLASWAITTLGPPGGWQDLARERFSHLVGTHAAGAAAPVPLADLRASGAYIDMTSPDEPEKRRLHPVGQHWPRVVCRPAAAAARLCGLLVESSSSLPVGADAFGLDRWMAAGLEVSAGAELGPTGERTLFALTPDAQNRAHALSLELNLGEGPAVFSLFARPGAARFLLMEVVGVGRAIFDLVDGELVDTSGTLLVEVEPWGDGLLRLGYSFDCDPGPGQLRVAVLDDTQAELFAGDGSVAAELGNAELRFRSVAMPLPTYGSIQPEDRLTYPAGNGNFPRGGAFELQADLWLPAAPLLTDAAIANVNFATRYDQQVNLFVAGSDGTVQFTALQGMAAPWALASAASLNDGLSHHVEARYRSNEASLTLDAMTVRQPADSVETSQFDRIEVGISTHSSGALGGILQRLRIAPVP